MLIAEGGLLICRIPCCADQAHSIVYDHLDWNGFQQGLQTSFGDKSFDKCRICQFRDNLGGDSSAEKNSAGSHHFQGEIACLCPVDTHKDFQHALANRTLCLKAVL